MAACGHTNEHWLHCMHLSACHSGRYTATPRFSYAAVPDGNVPSSIPSKALTGRSSPSCLFIGMSISSMNSGSSSYFSLGFSASAHSSGTSIFLIAVIPSSTAAQFISTIFCPFFLYVFSIPSLRYSTALSIGITSVSLKKAACMTILILLPRPTFSAIFHASIT